MPLNVLAPLAPPPTMASYTTPSPAASGASASGPPPLPGAAVGDVVEAPSRSDDLGAATSGSTVTAAADEGGGVQPSNVVIGEPKRATVVGGPSASIPGSPGTTSGADVATQVAAGPPGVSPSTAEAVASAGVPFASAQDRVLVPREAVGFVIGKSGETIKEMMARTGAHIEVDRGDVDPATPTRVFNILGDARACAAARTLIGEKVTGVLHNKPTSAAGIPNVLLPGTANSRELWVPGDRVGSIIGARGQVVRRLQEQSGATIVIHNERVNASAEKLVTIVGGVTELDHATTLIEDVIRKPRQPSLPAYPAALTGQNGRPAFFSPPGPPRTPVAGLSDVKTIYVPANCVGMLIGRGGDTIRELQTRSGASIRVLSSRDAASRTMDRPIFISGAPQAVEAAQAIIMEVVRACASGRPGVALPGTPLTSLLPGGPPLSPIMHSPRGGQAPPLFSPRFPTFPAAGPTGSSMFMGVGGISAPPMTPGYPWGSATSVTLHIPRDQLGPIVGRAGELLRDLQARTGARISIAKDSEVDVSCVTRPVTIAGMPSCVEAARSLIVERVSARGEGGAPAGAPGMGGNANTRDVGAGGGEGQNVASSYDAAAAAYMRNLSISGDSGFGDFDRSGDRELTRHQSTTGLGVDAGSEGPGGGPRQLYGSPYLAPGGAMQMVPPPIALASPSPMGGPLGGGAGAPLSPFPYPSDMVPYGEGGVPMGMYGGGQPGAFGDGGGGSASGGAAPLPQRPPYGPPVPYGSPPVQVPMPTHQQQGQVHPQAAAQQQAQAQQVQAAREQQQQQAFLAQQQAGMLYYYGGYGGYIPPMWTGVAAGPVPPDSAAAGPAPTDGVGSSQPDARQRGTTPPGYSPIAPPGGGTPPFHLQPQVSVSAATPDPALLPQDGDREVESSATDLYASVPASRAPGAPSTSSSRHPSGSPSPPPDALTTTSFPRPVDRVSPQLAPGPSASPPRELVPGVAHSSPNPTA